MSYTQFRESICSLQGRDPNELLSNEAQDEEDILPPPTYENIPTISEELQNNLDINKKRKLSSFILQDNVNYFINITSIVLLYKKIRRIVLKC